MFLKMLRDLPFDEIFVVIGASGDEILDKVDLSDVIVIENPEWEEGMASSLRVGLDAVLPAVKGRGRWHFPGRSTRHLRGGGRSV